MSSRLCVFIVLVWYGGIGWERVITVSIDAQRTPYL
jgi:hypothetical protein